MFMFIHVCSFNHLIRSMHFDMHLKSSINKSGVQLNDISQSPSARLVWITFKLHTTHSQHEISIVFPNHRHHIVRDTRK